MSDMAKANESLIDLEEASGSSPKLDVPIEPTSGSDIKVQTRPVRVTKLSNLKKESQKNELAFSLYAAINKELRAIDASNKEYTNESVTPEALDTCVENIEHRAQSITSEYAKLSQLSGNNVEKNIQKHFEFFISEIGKITQNILKRKEVVAAQVLEEQQQAEEQSKLQERRRLLEEEQQRFEQYMAEREGLCDSDKFSKNVQMRRNRNQSTESTPVRLNQEGCDTVSSTPQVSIRRTTPLDVESPDESERNQSSADPPDEFERHKNRKFMEKLQQFFEEETRNSTHLRTPSNSEVMQQLATEISHGFARTRKADIEPKIFSGDPLDFDDWEYDFDTYVTTMGIEGGEKLRFLKKYVSGQAKECIEGQFFIRTHKSYEQARQKLSHRYGSKLNVVGSIKSKLESWPTIQSQDASALQKYADYLGNCVNVMKTVPGLHSLNDEKSNERLAKVLPDWIQRKWGTHVYQIKKTEMRYPTFEEFALFVDDLAEMQAEPLLQNIGKSTEKNTTQQRGRNNTKSFHTHVDATEETCMFCKDDRHSLAECFKLFQEPHKQRIEFLRANKLCYVCTGTGHGSRNCNNKEANMCKRCKRPGHASCLHKTKADWDAERQSFQPTTPKLTMNSSLGIVATESSAPAYKEEPNANEELPPVSSSASVRLTNSSNKSLTHTSEELQDQTTKASNKSTKAANRNKLFNMGMPVFVSTSAKPEEKVLVYAFLDSASDHSYITKELANQLKPKQMWTKSIEVETMTGEVHKDEVAVFGNLVVNGYYSGSVALPSAYSWSHIPNSTGQFANNINVLEYPHLQPLANKLPPPMDIPVGLLLGANCTAASFPLEAIRGKENQPYALRSELGWAVFGHEERPNIKPERHTTCFTHIINDESCTMSQEDYQFMDIMNERTIVTKAGTYQMPLPFRARPFLPNNFKQAKKRQEALHKKFETDPKFKLEYTKFMDDLIKENLAEPVIEPETSKACECWYIPHFAVRHPQKQKLRVVFDCKASYCNTSLNDHLLQGPDLMNSLVGILCRFRKESIALSCDIQKMFYNFLVHPTDRDYLRFLWHDNQDQMQIYRMKVHLFGAKSSPAVATYGLRKIASDYQNMSTEAANFIRRDFYVDDGLTSVHSEDEAIGLINSSREICSKGNLRLHKFSSNSLRVLATLPETERSVQDKDLTSFLPEQRTLGLQWSMETDTFTFVNKLQNKPNTRRGILSVVSQLYDPLGFIAPYTLLGKNVLQQVNKMKLTWDEPIDDNVDIGWSNWLEQLPSLEKIRLERCYKPKDFGEVIKRELHHFCDASDNGIGACSYIRQVNHDGEVSVSFLTGKSKVIPSKGLYTIPRLELMAAVTATNLSNMLHKELDMKIDNDCYWSDSRIVLGYIANTSKRFSPFVHNRVRAITSTTDIDQWYHVPGHLNPADIASRGASCDQIIKSTWFSGPDFLKNTDISLLSQERHYSTNLDSKDPELKKHQVARTAASSPPIIADRFTKFSTWKKLTHAVAVLGNIHKVNNKIRATSVTDGHDIKRAEQKIILEVQKQTFAQDYKLVEKGQVVNKRSALYKLNPFIDEAGILRVGGRLQRSSVLGYSEKHPIILPREAHVTSLIVKHHHNEIHHQGRTFTQGALRSNGYWIIGSTRLVKSVINECITCRRLRGKPEQQIMADLPPERLQPTPPFTNIGMDCFGPIVVKERRSEVKRWGLLFTCLYSRAVHVEVLNDMTSDAMLNTLRSFICLRGPVKTIYCDNGTNFVGANNEMTKELQALAPEAAFNQFLKEQRIIFKLNAPHASHAGGVWERQIKSIRAVLEGMMRGKYNNRLDTAGLRTALYEAMATVNTRPLGVNGLNDPDAPILTPNHLLTSKRANVDPPPGDFETTEVYGRKMWRKVQQFAEEFWKLWKADYLQGISRRQKWELTKPNLEKGDIVLLIEDNVPRNQWPYGIVDETTISSDGKVRTVRVRLANRLIDKKGRVMHSGTTLQRPIQKLVLLQRHE